MNGTTTTRRQIGPAGDAGGFSLQWWRVGARVSERRAGPEPRRERGLNVGADAPLCPVGSASLASEARRAVVMVGARGDGEGSARRPVRARAAKATGARPLLRAVIGEDGDAVLVPCTGESRGVRDAEGGDGLLVAWGEFDAPVYESARDAAAGPREVGLDWVEGMLHALGVHPAQPLPSLTGSGPVARAVRDTAGLRSGKRVVRTLPSETSVRDARDAAAAAVAVWCCDYVTARQASEAAGTALDEAKLTRPESAADSLRFWVWLLAYRAARRELRAFRAAGLATRDKAPGERAPVVLSGDEGEAALATVRASADEVREARTKRQRALAFRAVAGAVAGLGSDATTATARARVRSGVRVILRVLARVMVGEATLAAACEAEGTTLDLIAQRAAGLGFWRALDDWQRGQRLAESRPLGWLGGAARRLREARARVPSSLPDAAEGGFSLPRPDARPSGRLARGAGVWVRPLAWVPGSIANPDATQGARAKARRRARGMVALADLVRARSEVWEYSRQAAQDLAERRAAWLAVSRGWRAPGRTSGKRKPRAKI